MRNSLPVLDRPAPSGSVELVVDAQHFHRIVREGILKATMSLDISTADFKAMLIPDKAGARNARSIVQVRPAQQRRPLFVRGACEVFPRWMSRRRCRAPWRESVTEDCRRMQGGRHNTDEG